MYHGAFKKSIWCFFCVLLGRQGSRSCGYFNAKLRGSRCTAKSDRSKAALSPRLPTGRHQRRGRDRESERATGGVRQVPAGWPAGADAPAFKWPLRSPPHGKPRQAAEACVRSSIARGTKDKGTETVVFCPPPLLVCFHGVFLKVHGTFVCVFLCRPGPRSCGYFHAKMRGTRRTAKSGRSKAPPGPTRKLSSLPRPICRL